MSVPSKPANRLLAGLTTKTYKQLSPALEIFDLKYKDVIYSPGDAIRHVYFPESGIISLLAMVDQDSTLEVGIVGSEGMIGLPVFLGSDRSDTQAIVQGTGTALRMKTVDLSAECSRSDELPKLLRRFANDLLNQISKSAACNRFHSVESRMARWLLMTQDRIRSDEFDITQEFLSNMIGVRREAVNKAATQLQERSLIGYHRGTVVIRDRKELESMACACYAPFPAR